MRTEDKLVKQLEKEFPEYTFEVTRVTHENDIKYNAIEIADKDDPKMKVHVYTQGRHIAEIKENVYRAILKYMVHKPDTSVITPEYIYDNVRIKLLNKDWNQSYIKDKPTVRINDDLIGVYYVSIGEDKEFELVNKQVHSKGLDMDKLHQAAINNMKKELCLTYFYDEEAANMLSFENQQCDFSLNRYEEIQARLKNGTMETPFVLSNNEGSYGAAGLILADDIFKNASEDIYLIPSSIHDIICVPSSMGYTPIDMEISLCELNDDSLQDFVLSDKVYKYDAESKSLQIVADRYGLVPQCSDTVISLNEVRKPHRSI